jgi:hypothetical protein
MPSVFQLLVAGGHVQLHALRRGRLYPPRSHLCRDRVPRWQDGSLVQANQQLGNIDLAPAQLKTLSMLHALHENQMPADIQQRIDAVPSQDALHKGPCPYFTSTRDMKVHLITKSISRQQRKRRFLDVLKNMQYIKDGHHSVGASYFDRKIAELQGQLAKL